jgi:hypothetical protein
MADADVNVRVNQTVQGDGLEQTRRKIEELYKAAAAYESRGMGGAAGSARGEAKSLERDLARDARERALSERDIVRSRREQQAVARASGDGGGMLGGMGGRMMGRIASALSIERLASMVVDDIDQTALGGLRVQAQSRMDQRQLRLMGGFRGSSGGVRSEQDSVETEIAQREGRRPELERQMQSGFLGAVGRMTGLRIGSLEGARAIKENEEELLRLQQKRAALAGMQGSKFEQEEAGLGLAAQRERIKGNFEEARTLDVVREGLAKYRSIREAGGTEAQGREGASQVVRGAQLDMMRGLGALASARDGAGNIEALRGLGAAVPWDEMMGRMDRQISLMETQKNADAKETFRR